MLKLNAFSQIQILLRSFFLPDKIFFIVTSLHTIYENDYK